MSDLAHLGIVFDTVGGEKAVETMTKVETKAKDVETATKRMADKQIAEAKRVQTLMDQVARGEMVKQVNPFNGIITYAPVARRELEATARATKELELAQRAQASATRAATLATQAQGTATKVMGGVVAEAKTSILGMVASFTLLGAAQMIIQALTAAWKDNQERVKAAADEQLHFNQVMAATQDAINGVTTATYKLRDAKLAAASAELAKQRAETQTTIDNIDHPGLFSRGGRGAQTDRAAAESRKAQLLAADIQLLFKDTNAYNEAVTKALPNEQRLKEIQAQRAIIVKGMANGALDAATGQRALNALDKQATDLTTVHTKAVRAHVAATKEQTFNLLKSGEVHTAVITKARLLTDGLDLTKPWEEAAQAVRDYADEAERRFQDVADAARNVTFAIDDIIQALKHGDGLSAGGGLINLIHSIGSAFTQGGVMGGTAAIATAGGSLLGGKVGGVLSGVGTGLGIAAMGAQLGAIAGTLGPLAGLATTIAPMLGPIGLAIGAGLALAALLKSKPTNAGAGFDLITGQLSGGKRTAETEQAATGAGQSILAGQQFLKDAGIMLKTTINGLVIGTRDQSQIYTSDGRTLFSAVGDAGAAAETALKAVLEGATYVSDAQRALVEGMLAAGKGFDDITASLESYKAAQALPQNIADAILQLTDPKKYDLAMLDRSQKDRRDQVTAAGAAGYFNADQLASIGAQLTTLDGLELAEVMKKYAVEVDAATDSTAAAAKAAAAFAQTLVDAQKTAQASLDQARSAALDAYNRETSALNATISKFEQLADSLGSYRASLTGAGANPTQQYFVAASNFNATRAKGVDGLADLQSVSEAFLNASRAVAPDARAYARDLAKVREAVAAGEKLAGDQVSIAQQQLSALTTMAQELGLLNTNILTFAQAVQALAAAKTAITQAGGVIDGGTTVRMPTAADYEAYARAYPGVLAAYNDYGAARGQTLAEFAKQQYLGDGVTDGGMVAGWKIPGFASGGSMDVTGPSYGDQVPVQLMANGGESVSVSRADNMARVADALEHQNALLEEQSALLSSIAKAGKESAATLTRATRGGTSFATVAA